LRAAKDNFAKMVIQHQLDANVYSRISLGNLAIIWRWWFWNK